MPSNEQLPPKASILGALSYALDLVEGQPKGHAIRTAQLSLRLADALHLTDSQLENLYYAALLKDSGCSNNSVRVQKIFGGDEHVAKYAVKLSDWTSSVESLKFVWHHTEVGRSVGAKLRRMALNIGTPKQVMNEVTEARCTRGAEIARLLSLDEDVSDAILYLDEHWDGKGAPYGKVRDESPLLSRILSFMQTYEVFLTAYGLEAANVMAKDRSGTWFDPDIVLVALDIFSSGVGLENLGSGDEVFDRLPHLKTSIVDADIDAICEAFAQIVDAKSSFTSEHSTRVKNYAIALAEHLGFSQAEITTLSRGALLHDIGKLGVPTGILEKPGKLDEVEFERIRCHPRLGQEILDQIPGFDHLAEIASAHHERLDGKGYWQGLSGDSLNLSVRIVTVCDVFDALTAKRPYREALPLEKVWGIMDSEAGVAFDHDCLEALKKVQEENKLVS
ncbi:HD domain-containing phosphohydrolase [Kamptonema cortianum]|nr:HD domain-containing phosphohydrolase [Geitlerinema splendidum]MDK3162447.1 HD domain-containing phosphohydrolase [Kamptonema cortianum]